MAYIGNEPGVGTFIVSTERFNGTGSCTQFTITQTGIQDANVVDIIVNSVPQDPINSYSIANGVITFTEAPSSGTQNIIVRYRATTVITYSSVSTSQILDGAVTASKIASGVLPSAAANSAGVYANSAFSTANLISGVDVTQNTNITNAGTYANSAFAAANTADSKGASAGSYANSAFLTANTPNHVANSASSYANSGFAVANSAASYANSGFAKANSVVLSVIAGSGISVSGATGNVTISAGGGGVTSLNGQTGAITDTNFDSIGSYAILVSAQTSDTAVGGTIAGSSLRYNLSSINGGGGPGGLGFFAYTNTSGVNSYNGGGSAVSGTWRKMQGGRNWNSADTGCTIYYYFYSALWVRIS